MTHRISLGLGQVILIMGLVLFQPHGPAVAHGPAWDPVQSLVGEKDGVYVADFNGKVIFSHQPDRLFIPASILKIFTALVALDQLGPQYRFRTGFFLENGRDLRIKGYGDPMFISEAIRAAASGAAQKLGGRGVGCKPNPGG